jgi:hypothetical protein
VLVVGNSHAKDIFNALHQNAELYPGLDFVRGPVPQISCFDADNPHNRAKAEAFFASKAYAASDAILVSTQWIRGQCNPKDKSLQKSTDLAGLPHLIERAKADGKGVVVMGNTVQFDDMDGKWVLDRLVSAAEAAGELDAITLDEDRYQAFARKVGSELFSRMNRRSEVNRQVRAIAEAQDVSYFDKFAYMCDARAKRCEGLTDQGRKVFYDYGHYTLEGARFFGERMARTELPALLEAAVAGR